MSATSDSEPGSIRLVDIIDLKWLFAHEGIHLHVEHLQDDPAYARRLLAQAEGCSNPSLRDAAVRMRRRLGLANETG